MRTSNKLLLSVMFFASTLISLSQSNPKATAKAPQPPRFEDYPVTEVFKGTPAPPILATPVQREFRTRIRSGVSTCEGVWYGSWRDPNKKPGPNFSGHYFVIRWGCGSQCA
jgi:hypothetical protein